MKPRQHTLTSPDAVHAYFRAFRSHPPAGWWFRGQADSSWKLLPKAGRADYFLPKSRHLGRFNSWTNQAIAYLPDLPSNDWERLAVAQHYGLATCLLDWTFNPLVALYFACSEHPDRDGMVFCFDPASFIDVETADLKSLECVGAGLIPRAISTRILSQKACFTVHLPPDQPIPNLESELLKGEPNVAELLLPAGMKQDLLQMLDDYGVNRVTLFPDLEGLSAHVNWETSAMADRYAKRIVA